MLFFRLGITRVSSSKVQRSQRSVVDGLSWRGLKGNNELTSVSASSSANGGLWTRRLLTTVG